LRTNSCRL